MADKNVFVMVSYHLVICATSISFSHCFATSNLHSYIELSNMWGLISNSFDWFLLLTLIQVCAAADPEVVADILDRLSIEAAGDDCSVCEKGSKYFGNDPKLKIPTEALVHFACVKA